MTPEPEFGLPWLNVAVPSTTTAACTVLVSHEFRVPPWRTNRPLAPASPPPLAEMTVYLTFGLMYTVSVPLNFSVATHSSEMLETVRLWFSRLIVLTSMRFGPQIIES